MLVRKIKKIKLTEPTYTYVKSHWNKNQDIFTIVGSPTITEDGIASGLNTSNYVTCISPDIWATADNWHLHLTEYCPFSAVTPIYFLFLGDLRYGYFDYNNAWNSIVLNVYDTSNTLIFIAIERVRSKFSAGNIDLDIYYSNETGYYFTVTQGDVSYTSSKSTNTNKLRYATNNLVQFRNNDIDLKTISFEVDGVEVFSGAKAMTEPYTLMQNTELTTDGGLHEWVYGRGLSSYIGQQDAVKQDILTSLYCFTNDCYYDLEFGIDWRTRLGFKNQKQLLDTDIQNIINEKVGVIRVTDFTSTLVGRSYSCNCKVYTEYSTDYIDLDFSNEV